MGCIILNTSNILQKCWFNIFPLRVETKTIKNKCTIIFLKIKWYPAVLMVLFEDISVQLSDYRYRVTHKGWDWKDDLKSWKVDFPMVKLSLLPWIKSFNGLINNLAKKESSLQFQGIMDISWNRQFRFHSAISKFSSFVGNPLYKAKSFIGKVLKLESFKITVTVPLFTFST